MPVCPHCKREIDHLLNEQVCYVTRPFRKFEGGRAYAVYSHGEAKIGDVAWDTHNDYNCPECLITIATTEAKAEDFLFGQ